MNTLKASVTGSCSATHKPFDFHGLPSCFRIMKNADDYLLMTFLP